MVHLAFRDSINYGNGLSLGHVQTVAVHVQYRDDGTEGDSFVTVDERMIVVNAMCDDRRNIENSRIATVIDQALCTPQGSLQPSEISDAGIAAELVDTFPMRIKESFDWRQFEIAHFANSVMTPG